LIKATKSKALGPIPNFSIGLTPSDEEKSDDNKANMRGKKMQKKLDPKNRGKNKEQTAEEETDEGSSDDNNSQKKGKQMANKSDQKNHGKRKSSFPFFLTYHFIDLFERRTAFTDTV
jgi:hypothetical protein